MRSLDAVRRGLLQGATSPRLALLLVLVNLSFAALLAYPLALSADRLVAPRGGGEDVAGAWPRWLDTDFRNQAAPLWETSEPLLGLAAVLFMFIAALLSAGAFGVLHRGQGAFSAGSFFRGCGEYGFRFIRLVLCFFPFAWGLWWLAGIEAGDLAAWLADRATSQRMAVIVDLVYQALVLLLWGVLAAVFDVARALMVVDRRRSAVAALVTALMVCGRNPASIALIRTLIAALMGSFLLASGWLVGGTPPATWAGIGALFMAGQGILLVRSMFRIAQLESLRLWLEERPGRAT